MHVTYIRVFDKPLLAWWMQVAHRLVVQETANLKLLGHQIPGTSFASLLLDLADLFLIRRIMPLMLQIFLDWINLATTVHRAAIVVGTVEPNEGFFG